jgi:hypothetical protein
MEGNATARFHQGNCWISGGVAARSARASNESKNL